MTKLIILLVSTLFTTVFYAQSIVKDAESMNSCAGSIHIFESGDFQLQFTGEKSDDVFKSYTSLSNIESENQLWCSFIASENGKLNFSANVKSNFLQMVIFSEMEGDICKEIKHGSSEISRVHARKNTNSVGLNEEIGDGIMYTLEMRKGQKINLLFATEKESKEVMNLSWQFTEEQPSIIESKIIDKRTDDFAPTFSIKVRDKNSRLPLIANVSIEEAKSINGLYVGSDLFFNVDRNCKMVIKCDVEGYFFDDRIEAVSSFEDQEIEIYLERVASGKSIQIEEIEFNPGTSIITKSSEPKLRRLKDFLALNSDISIEIQGHVFAVGDNSFAGQKISEARAKRVLNYLVNNGIDKKRLDAVGYGNTRPVYPEPKFSYEEQANRRVEVLIK